MNIFWPIKIYICFGCSKEQSHWDGSFEYPHHMFWLWNMKVVFNNALIPRYDEQYVCLTWLTQESVAIKNDVFADAFLCENILAWWLP